MEEAEPSSVTIELCEFSVTITKYFQEASLLLEHVNNKYLDSSFERPCLKFNELTNMVAVVKNTTYNIQH